MGIPDFVNEKMDIILDDFKENLKDKNNYCKLKQLRFNNNNKPDYRDKVVQQYYLLKYLPAYITEYYTIYKKAINYNFLDSRLKILSIGCGCYLDLWALNYAVENSSYRINDYTGIDVVSWNYRDSLNQNVHFIHEDVNSISRIDDNEYNVIIFPKSIGEFDDDKFEQLKVTISNSVFSQDKVIMISSIRKTSERQDKSRLKELAKVMSVSHRYWQKDSVISSTKYAKKEDESEYYLNEVVKNLSYPKNARNYLSTFYNGCNVYDNNARLCSDCNKDECMSLLTRNPVTTMSQVDYQMIRLCRR